MRTSSTASLVAGLFLAMGALLLRNRNKAIATDSRLTRPGMWAGFLTGLVDHCARHHPGSELTVIGNTADDLQLFGLHVSPDLDTVMYTLGGGVHAQQVFACGGCGTLHRQFGRQAGHVDQVLEPTLAFGGFGQVYRSADGSGTSAVQHGQHRFRLPGDSLQDQGRELLDHLRLLDAGHVLEVDERAFRQHAPIVCKQDPGKHRAPLPIPRRLRVASLPTARAAAPSAARAAVR